MSAAATLSDAAPPVAGGAVPARQRLLGVVQGLMQTGMAMARCVNRIARQRLEGQPLSRLGPPGFNPTLANALIVEAVAWTAALRERLLARVGRPALVVAFALAPGRPKAARTPQGRGAAFYLPERVPNPTEDDWHDWRELARPLRIGPGGVAVASQMIASLSSEDVVAGVCDKLSRGLAELGNHADVAAIAAVEATARELAAAEEAAIAAEVAAAEAAAAAAEAAAAAPDVAAPDAGAAEVAESAGGGDAVPVALETGSPRAWPETGAERDRPPKPPD